jgi:predicted phage tail protein
MPADSLRTIRVYGELRQFLGRAEFRAVVRSAAEALRFLIANVPGLEAHMADRYYRVIVGGRRALADERLHEPIGDEVIRIVPTVAGAGGDVGKILLGVALIGLTIATGGATSPLFVSAFGVQGAALFAGAAFTLGGALILSGVGGILTPTRSAAAERSDPKRAESFNFSGITNVSRQGLPVPVIYGETIVGSITISAGITSDQVAV